MTTDQKPKRAKRSDAGIIRQTGRDAELMEWISHMYGIPVDLLQYHLGVGEVRVGQIVRRWEKAGWVKRDYVDAGSMWIWPTKATANRFLGWDAREWKPRPTTAAHTRAVAAVRAHRTGFDLNRWDSERGMWHEHGWRMKDEEYPHLPDGVEILANGDRVLIEVELTAKSRTRYLSKEREFGGGMNTHEGLIPEIQRRAGQLSCSSIAYWCSSTALPVVREVVNEYKIRVDASKDKRYKPMYVRNLNEEVPKWETPGWVRRLTGGS